MTGGIGSLLDVAGRVGLFHPLRVPALAASTARWGPTIAAPIASTGLTHPNRTAVIDDRGALSYSQLDRRSTQLAKGLHQLGIRRGEHLGLACRNHRDFVELTVAAAKAGVGVVHLSTSFAPPQMAEVVDREQIAALAIDADLLHLLPQQTFRGPVIVAATGARSSDDLEMGPDDDLHTIDSVRRSAGLGPLRASLPVPPILLTSGTTGTPKGARRGNRVDPSGAAGIVDRIPYRHDDIIFVTSPLFHAWGLAQLFLASALGATVVLSDSFDAADTLARIERDQVSVLAVVPAIVQRLLESPALEATDLSSLRIVASSGSALPVPVVREWLDRVGPNLYNLYGSTEVGQATLATPDDLRAHPATAGRVLTGSQIAILDDDRLPVASGTVGTIFVGNGTQFESYTGGGGKEIVDDMMSSGDVGHLDDDGLLFVTGRADDMIVSGGENVFPQEVEDLLLSHPAIADVAVVGVDDDSFGQRLAVYVVKKPGARLSVSTVKALVVDNLARHKTPRDVHFIGEIPRTATGKILRNRLG